MHSTMELSQTPALYGAVLVVAYLGHIPVRQLT